MTLFRGVSCVCRAGSTPLLHNFDNFASIKSNQRMQNLSLKLLSDKSRSLSFHSVESKCLSYISFLKPIGIIHQSVKSESTSPSSSSQSLSEQLLSSKVKSTSQENEEPPIDDSKTKDEEKKKTVRALKFSFVALGLMVGSIGGSMLFIYGAPLENEKGVILKDEFSDLPLPKQYFFRTVKEVKMMNKMIQEPTRDQLLPDPLKEPYFQPTYTLVLELKDILVHPEWTYNTGWRFKKRPGVDFLLQHCAPPLFEIVIYTGEQGFTAYPVIDQLDPNGFIWYKLFKDSTRYEEGKHLKDLYCLNRDLNKVIMVDWDPNTVMSKRNQLCIPRWKGEMQDQSLVDLAVMLRTMAESQISDVREVLDYYRKYPDPVAAFMENQRAAQEQEKEMLKQREETIKSRSLGSSFASNFLKRK